METVQLLQDQIGQGVIPSISWPPSTLVGSVPSSTSVHSTLFVVVVVLKFLMIETFLSIMQGIHNCWWIV